MDGKLYEAVQQGDVPAFLDFIKEDKDIIKRSTFRNLNSVLHIAAKFEHLELASEIIKLLPEMASAENEKKETPLHEACREGHLDVMELLIETDHGVSYKRNCYNESVLLVACAGGQLHVVKHLLNNSRLLMLEDDGSTTSLHVAALKGHLDIVKVLLNARPDLARIQDFNGFSPLHFACKKGHSEIARELIRIDPELSSLQDNDGRTPMHWAAIKGRVNILKKILLTSMQSVKKVTAQGETVLHLAVKNNQYDVIKRLYVPFHLTSGISSIVNSHDQDGNTILHLATARKLTNMVKYLVDMTDIDVNALNRERLTALDVVDNNGNSVDSLQLKSILEEAGGKRCNQLSPAGSPNIRQDIVSKRWNKLSPGSPNIRQDIVSKRWNKLSPGSPNIRRDIDSNGSPNIQRDIDSKRCNQLSPGSPNIRQDIDSMRCNQLSPGSPNIRRDIDLSGNSSTESGGIYKMTSITPKILGDIENNLGTSRSRRSQRRRERQLELHIESLRNARNTIVILAVLIATVTFAAGINPPGGVHQDGLLIGKAIMGTTTSYKIFMVCNNVALFSSLGIVIVLVSVITFDEKPLKKLLSVTHKVMWVSVSFMTVAYIAATWVIMPPGEGTKWMLVTLLSTGGGCLMSIFVGLGVMFARHLLRKTEPEEKPNYSFDTDLAHSGALGMYPLVR